MKNTQAKKTIGGGIMHRFFKKLKSTRGFTLVELLIVVAILGVLSAVVLPNGIGVSNSGQTEAAKTEFVTVQSAMDVMMAKLFLTTVTATAATQNMSSFPTGHPLYPTYLRTANTKGTYSCDATGLVTQTSTGY